VPGYPIRTSSDPSSVDSSPRHIAASHVLHRLSMPRHPPCALTHLQTQKPTIKKIKIAQNKHTTPTKETAQFASMLATTIQLPNTTPHHQVRRQQPLPTSRPGQHRCCLRTQQCAGDFAPRKTGDLHKRRLCCCAPGWRHYSAQPLHGLGQTQCLNPFRGAP
jgi:hypothetical protein